MTLLAQELRRQKGIFRAGQNLAAERNWQIAFTKLPGVQMNGEGVLSHVEQEALTF